VLSLPTTQLNSALRQLVESSTQSSDGFGWPSLSRRCPRNAVNQLINPSTNRYSPKLEVEHIPPTPNPAGHPVIVPCRRESKELSWRARCIPPDWAVTTRRHNLDVVNINISPSVTGHPPSLKVVNRLPAHPPKTLRWAEVLQPSGIKLAWHARSKLPNVVVSLRRQNLLVVSKTSAVGEAHSLLLWAETMPPKTMIFVLGNDPGMRLKRQANWVISQPTSVLRNFRVDITCSSRLLLASP